MIPESQINFSPADDDATTAYQNITPFSAEMAHLKEKSPKQNALPVLSDKNLTELYPIWLSTVMNDATDEYNIIHQDNVYSAVNPIQNLAIRFYPTYVELANLEVPSQRWQMGLIGYGYGKTTMRLPSAHLVCSENRANYWYGELNEWYINGPLGLEQGFTLNAPPEKRIDKQALVFTLAFSTGSAIDTDAQSLLLNSVAGQPVFQYGQFHVNDARGCVLPVCVEVDESQTDDCIHLHIIIDDTDAVYPIVVDPIVQQATLTTTDSGISVFGTSISISGDTVAISSATGHDANGPVYSIYVFVRNGATWVQQAKFAPAGQVSNDNFGASVALDRDTALVGAPGNSLGVGTAYIFTRNGVSWAQQAQLIGTDTVSISSFGNSVAVNGNTAVIGANFTGPNNTGAAYVFVRNGVAWTQQAKLNTLDPANSDNIGSSVALSGDTALVGAAAKPVGTGGTGATYVFIRNGSTWAQQAKLLANDTINAFYFGSAVALSGDTALVGANGTDPNNSTGAAYVFVRNGTNWIKQARLTASDAAPISFFGYSVALTGDTALVGNLPNTASGGAYVFTRSGTIWSQQPKLSPGGSNRFGISVSLSSNTAIVADTITNIVYVFLTNADATVIPNQIAPANANTSINYGIAGASITAGQVVFIDKTANFQIKPAQATNFNAASSVVGIALNTAAIGQPITYAIAGDVYFSADLVPTTTYVLSPSNAGGIAADTSLITGNYASVIGIATSTTNLRLGVAPVATAK